LNFLVLVSILLDSLKERLYSSLNCLIYLVIISFLSTSFWNKDGGLVLLSNNVYSLIYFYLLKGILNILSIYYGWDD
jgi:hypothetical protein